jgi:hypothetical protein
MVYTIKHSEWQWLIEPNSTGKGYLLKYKRPMRWKDCKSFDSPKAAAEALASGKTGVKEWDGLKHEKPFPSFSAWLIDPTGSAFDAVTDLLRAAINAPTLPPTASGV